MFRLFSISLYFVSFLPLWVSVIFVDILSIMENSTDKGTEYTSICCILIMMLISCTVIYHEMHKHSLKINEECQVAITEQFGKYLIMKAKNLEESSYHLIYLEKVVRRKLWII